MKVYDAQDLGASGCDLAILYAVPLEGELLVGALRNSHRLAPKVTGGTLFDKTVVLVETSVGKTNAAMAATFAIMTFAPKMVVSTGICGAYPGTGLDKGDIAVAGVEIYGDEGVLMQDGFHTMNNLGNDLRDSPGDSLGKTSGIPLLIRGESVYYNAFPFDETLVSRVMDNLGKLNSACPVHYRFKAGTFLTLSTATGTDSRAGELIKTFNPLCENMEGAAVAHVSTAFGTTALEIRGVSNLVENRDISRWDIKTAARRCQEVLLHLIESSNSFEKML